MDVRKILNLVAKLKVLSAADESGIPIQEVEQPVHFVPKDPNNPRSPLVVQIIPDEGIHVNGIPTGDFLFRLDLFHRSPTQGDILLASIDEAVTIQNGEDAKVDFAGSAWRYDFDDDEDGYGNVTELMSGHFEKRQDQVGGSTKVWISEPTDPENPASHPSQVSIIESSRIGSTSPDNDGHAKVIGDPLSVQSGVEVTVVHRAADGTVKETLQVFSRLDGSFEVSLNNSIQGDKVQVYTTSLPSMGGDSSYSSLSVSDPSFSSVNLEIHFLPVKVNACFSINGRNSFPETGFIVIQAEGLGGSEADSEVIFPTEGSGGVSATEFYISSQAAKLTELTVKIPDGAISGFPIVHNRIPNHESYGRCAKDQDVVVLQTKTSFGATNQSKPDLFSDLLDAPFVALVGQSMSLNYHMLNQGVGDTFSAFQYRTYISPDHNQDISDADQEIYPNSAEMDILSDPSHASQTITGQIRYGDAPLNLPLSFVLKKIGSVINSTIPLITGKKVYFKAVVDPTSSPFSQGIIQEGNEQNNLTVSSHNTFVHYMDLLLEGSNSIAVNQGGQLMWEELDQWSGVVSGSAKPLTLNTEKSQFATTPLENLILRHGALHLKLGNIKNRGSYPLHRNCDSQGNCTYTNSNPDDPLNTGGEEYQINSQLASQIDQVNGETDLAEPDAFEQKSQADDMNLSEFPVVIRAYFSTNPDPQYDPFTGKFVGSAILGCKGCEFCHDRLEGEEGENIGNDKNQSFYQPKDASENPKYTDSEHIDIDVRLDTGAIPVGAGNLYVIAEPLMTNLDDVKQIGTKNFNYCGKNELERQALNQILEGDNSPKPLRDFDFKDNLIKIPISASAPDYLMGSFGIQTGSQIDLGSSITAVVSVTNQGNATINLGPQVGFSFEGANVPLGGGVGFGALDPSVSSIATPVSVAVPANSQDLSQLEAVPFGPAHLIATVDTGDQIYEANPGGTGETNNSMVFNVNVVAPDLKIFAIGVGSSGTCDATTGNCVLKTSLDSTLQFDVFVRNEGTGQAKAGYSVKILSSNECFMSSTGAGPALQPGKVVKVPVTVQVSSVESCYSPMGLPVIAEVNPGSDRLVEHVNDTNPQGVLRAWENNTQIPKRFAIGDLTDLPFDPQTTTSQFTDQTSQAGGMILSAVILRSDLQAIDGSVAVFEEDGTAAEKLLTGRTYTITFDVKNNGDGSSSSTETVDAFLEEQGGSKLIPLIPVNNTITLVESGATVNKPVKFKLPADQSTWPGNGTKEGNPFKVKIKVNPDNDPKEQNTLDNQAKSSDTFGIYHIDLTVSEVHPENTNNNCGQESNSVCPFAVANEALKIRFKIQASGTEGHSVPDFSAAIGAVNQSGTIIPLGIATLPNFEITSDGTAQLEGNMNVLHMPSEVVQVYVQADVNNPPNGDVLEADESNNIGYASVVMHVRPVADGGDDQTGPTTSFIYLPGFCLPSESGVTLSGRWCNAPGNSCEDYSSSFPIYYKVTPVSGSTNTYRLTCSADFGATFLAGTDDVSVTGL